MSVFAALERTTAIYSATLQDDSGSAIAKTDLSTLTLTLYDVSTGDIINSRDAQNVLDANNCTVSSVGVVTWEMQPADNAIVTSTERGEKHVALFEWSWSAGGSTRYSKKEVTIIVQNLTQVP